MSTNNDDRYRGDGSADRERLSRKVFEEILEPYAPKLSEEEIERRNKEIEQEMVQQTIEGFRIVAAESRLGKERYYRSQWKSWRKVRGGEYVREALREAAELDGVDLED